MENIFDWIYKNREVVLSCYLESGESPKKTWDRLTGMFPELDGLTKFNSFKTYLKPTVEMLNRVQPEMEPGDEKFNEVKQSLEAATAERDRLQAELDELTERFNEVQQERDELRKTLNLLNRTPDKSESGLAGVKQALDEATTENGILKTELMESSELFHKVKQDRGFLLAENERLKAEIERMKSGPKNSTNIDGWTLSKTGGYFKLYKKVDGKVKGIHLGKAFDRERAVEKIRAKEAELGINRKL